MAAFSQAHYDHTIVGRGLAKAYSMTGWRLGCLAAPEPIAKAIDAVQGRGTSNPTSFAPKQEHAVAPLDEFPSLIQHWGHTTHSAYEYGA